MDITKLQRAVVDALEDVKAQDIQVFNTTHLTSLFDRVIICSATSNRQTRSLANSVCEKVKSIGGDIIATDIDPSFVGVAFKDWPKDQPSPYAGMLSDMGLTTSATP